MNLFIAIGAGLLWYAAGALTWWGKAPWNYAGASLAMLAGAVSGVLVSRANRSEHE